MTTRLCQAITLTFVQLAVLPAVGFAVLNSWQRPAEPAAMANPNAGGTLIVDGDSSYLPRVRYHVDVHIEDGFARTTIDQVYYNRTRSRLEGTYRFPLPGGASISRLAMTVKGELLEGGMVEQKRAAAIYDEIRNQRRDPVLLEWIDGRTFKMRVFPIEPNEYKRILISYTQRLEEIDGHWHYRFPGTDLEETQEWSAMVRAVGARWRDWECDTHEFQAGGEDGDLLLEAKQSGKSVENRLALRIEAVPRADAMSCEYMDSGEHRYAMVRWRPEIGVAPAASGSGAWVVLFEASADRDPVYARQQIDALRALVAAYPDDLFKVISANTEATEVIDLGELDNVHLIGALDLAGAFTVAARQARTWGDSIIVHLGTGRPTLGERRVEELVQLLPEETPYIGAGIGHEVNAALMGAAAKRSGGAFLSIEDGPELVKMARRVIGRGKAVSISGGGDARFLTDTDGGFSGGDFFAVARLGKNAPLPETLTFQSQLAGGEWQREVRPQWRKTSAGYLPRTWARMEIGRLAQDGEAQRTAIVELSQRAFVMSPFTSLLVLESAEMHEQYGIGQGRADHWAKYTAPIGKLLYQPDGPPPPAPRWDHEPQTDPRANQPGMERFGPKFPRPMFIGTPVAVRLPNLEGRRLRGSDTGAKAWRPMFAGQLVRLAEDARMSPRLEAPGRPRLTFHAPVGTELLSRGCEVSASDELPIIGEVDMITDGDKDGADGSYVELAPGRQWVQLDLGARRELWAIVLWHFHKNARAYLDVVVQISDDPGFRFGVRTIYNNDHDNSSRLGIGKDKAWVGTNHGRIIDVPGTAARYLRFYSHGNTANEMNHYVEIEVWGREGIGEARAGAGKTVSWDDLVELEAKVESEWLRQHEAKALRMGWLRDSHSELLSAMVSALNTAPPPEGFGLEQRIMRIADRWWGIDAGSWQPCQMAAELFGQLGREDLQWRYLTTPVAVEGGSAASWRSVESFAESHRKPAMAELARREANFALRVADRY